MLRRKTPALPDTALDALGNPERRKLVIALSQGPRSVGELAAEFPISRPAVSRHLALLERANLISHRAEGTRNVYFLDKAGLEGMVSKRKDSVYRSGNSTAWLKIKSYAVDEYDLLGVEREPGKPAFALMAERSTGRYVGAAFITLNREMRERLWQRVQEHAGPAPNGMKRPATQWVKPGLVGRVKHMRGEDDLRHASLQDFRED